jgi:uncharacterized protein (DUF2384 family)
MSAGAAQALAEEPVLGGPGVWGSLGAQAEPEASDSQDEIAMVRRATEVLGVEHVAHGMQSRIPALDHRAPYALIKTETGRSQVERVLLKIEHGVY